MQVTATDAKNRLGHMLEQCQREPVVIEKSGRRHSVLISAAHYDALVAAQDAAHKPVRKARDAGREFYEKYKSWVDWHNDLVDRHGIPFEQFRPW